MQNGWMKKQQRRLMALFVKTIIYLILNYRNVISDKLQFTAKSYRLIILILSSNSGICFC